MITVHRHKTTRGFDLEGPVGRASVEVIKQGVLHLRYEGLGYEAFVPEITAMLDGWVAEGYPIQLLVDASRLTSYETGYRKRWTAWMRNNQANMTPVCILFSSKIVQMGINLVNPLIGNMIEGLSDPAEFEARLRLAHAAAG